MKNVSPTMTDLFLGSNKALTIRTTPFLQKHAFSILRESFKYFLGISIKDDLSIEFKIKDSIFSSFETLHDFPFSVVLSRAVRTAILLNMFESDTIPMVQNIVAAVREKFPNMGMLQCGVDSILGSREMQEVLLECDFPRDALIAAKPSVLSARDSLESVKIKAQL